MHSPAEFTGTFSQEPLQLSGTLDQFKSFDVTPCIGTEFQDVNLAEWITSKNSDTILRDLAILSIKTSSSRAPAACRRIIWA